MAAKSEPAKSKRAGPALKKASLNAWRPAENVVEIAPVDVDPSFIQDRLSLSPDPDFVELIRKDGQQAPILVRPHPEQSGRYQVAYGHRRLKAASALGHKVRAIVRPMTDVELVVAQGQENAARRDLTYIERGLFAAELERRGFDRSTIIDALIVDKAELSRLIAAATRVPRDLLNAIGPAPKAGRPRWESFIKRIETPGALQKARAFARTKMFEALYSDDRFSQMLERLGTGEPTKSGASDIMVDEGAIGSIRTTKTATTFRFDNTAAPEFATYLASQLDDIYRAWKSTRQS